MCGIAGANIAPEENVNARDLSIALLLGIEERGRDATGAAFFEDGQPFVQKTDMAASEFVEYLEMKDDVSNIILHTRRTTQGSERNNANNHPVDVNGLIGVHNGVIYNDDALFRRIESLTGVNKRIAQVDSEAIFATLLHGQEKAPDALSRVDGSAAVAWIESYGDPDVMHVSRVSFSPVVYAFTEAGSFVFASTEKALRTAMGSVGMRISGGPYTLQERTYLRVRRGEIVLRMRYESLHRREVLSSTERKALNMV